MNLVKRLSLPLMLSAAIFSSVNSCITVGPWTPVSTESEVISSTPYQESMGNLTRKEKKLDISEFALKENSYQAKVTESLEEVTSTLIEFGNAVQFGDMQVQEQKTTTDLRDLIVLGGGIAGMLLTKIMVDSPDRDDFLGWGSLGALTGFGLKAILPKPMSTVETRKEYLRRRWETTPSGRKEEPLGRTLVYSGGNPGVISVGIVGKGTFKTDSDGIISFGESKTMYLTRESLTKGLKDYPLIEQIKPAIRGKLEERILEAISSRTVTGVIETRESSTNPELSIINGAREFNLPIYEIKDEIIYSVITQFVEEEINPKIKPVKFSVEDQLTHFPIRDSQFKFDVVAPSKSELADEYFTLALKEHAMSKISDYLRGKTTLECLDTLSVQTYCPSRMDLEIVSKGYNFVRGTLYIWTGVEKTVYMVDLGQKLRVESVTGSVGSIE